MPVLPKLIGVHSTLNLLCLPVRLDGMWTYLHIVKTVAWLMIPQVLSSQQNMTARPMTQWVPIYPGPFKVNRHFLLSEF